MEQLANQLWSFPIELPENPLKWLNCYVIRNPSKRNLLIDTGFRRPECLDALLRGMRELSLRPEDTDIFLTHLHADHTGNAKTLQDMGCRLYMSRTDWKAFTAGTWGLRKKRMLEEGMPQDILTEVTERNPALKFASEPFEANCLEEGDTLCYGGYSLRCILTPGHTPGHMCLYDEEKKLMFLGDHVLFDITPNICNWTEMEDALGSYLDSLRKIRGLAVETALPGHRRRGACSLTERIDALLTHHEQRLAEAKRIIEERPGIHAYELAGLMTWRIRARNWQDFPAGQKWFAVGETLSHLDYLVLRNEIRRFTGSDGIVKYEALPGKTE